MTKVGTTSGVSSTTPVSEAEQTRPKPAPEQKAATAAPVPSGAKAVVKAPPPKPVDVEQATSDCRDACAALYQLDKDTHEGMKPHDPDDQDKVASGLHKAEKSLKTAEANLAAAKKAGKDTSKLEVEVKELRTSIARVRTSAAERGFIPGNAQGDKTAATSAAREKAAMITGDFGEQWYVQQKSWAPETLVQLNKTPWGVVGHRERTQRSLKEAHAFIGSAQFKALPKSEQDAFKAKVAQHEATAKTNGWA